MEPFSLEGVNGNAYCVMGYVSNAMRQAHYTEEKIKEYQNKATSSDYNHLLAVSCAYVCDCNQRLGLKY